MKKIIILLIGLVLISGCNETYRYVTNCDQCVEGEWCYKDMGMVPSYQCIKYEEYDIEINESKFYKNNKSVSIILNNGDEGPWLPYQFIQETDDMFCYTETIPYTFGCDVLVYPDGHVEKYNCFTDAYFIQRCINLTKENITLMSC